jgi:hypothetical protein
MKISICASEGKQTVKIMILALGLMAGLLMAGTSQAILIDRGNGLIYDGANDISWTKDAGISGPNNWDGQVGFAAGLTLAGFHDFRLASVDELVSLYGQLPGAPGSNKTGDISPFEDIQSAWAYWSGTEVDALNARLFFFFNAAQVNFPKEFDLYGWAVRSGDSAAVPEPGSVALMGVGLGVLWLARRWRKA